MERGLRYHSVVAKPGRAVNRVLGFAGAIALANELFAGAIRIIDRVSTFQTAVSLRSYMGFVSNPIVTLVSVVGGLFFVWLAIRREHAQDLEEAPRLWTPEREPEKPKTNWFWLRATLYLSVVAIVGAGVVTLVIHRHSLASAGTTVPVTSSSEISGPPESHRNGNQLPLPAKPSSNSAKSVESTTTPGQPDRPQTSAVVIVQNSTGSPVSGAQILLVSPNGTHTAVGVTDSEGIVRLSKPSSIVVDVYCAHSGYSAYLSSGHDPTKALQIKLRSVPGVGSLIQAGEGYIEILGLDGGWDPRTYPSGYPNAGNHYVYVKNLSVNGHLESLVSFKVGQNLVLEDNNGHRVELRLIAANAESFLMQYRKL